MSVEKFKKQSDDEVLKQMFQANWKDTLSVMYKKFCFDTLSDLHKIKDNWKLIVKSDDLYEFTEPVSFENGVLDVKITYSVVRSEFLSRIDDIKLNLSIIAPDVTVKDIRVCRK